MSAIKLITAVVLLISSNAAWAEAGDWLVRVGGLNVSPKSDNNDLVEVDDSAQLTFDITYFMTSNWAVEVLASIPFSHDINIDGGPRVGDTKHLPPTVSAQYHFIPDGNIRPYVGLGVNYTIFFQEDTTGPLAGTDLKLDASIGLAAQVGVDFDIGENIFVNAVVRYIDIETDAEVKNIPDVGTLDVGTVEIDPVVFGLSLGMRF